MRALIVRFLDAEGPGILGTLLKEKGYQLTYHNAYQKGLQLIPNAHQIFEFVLLLGGPMSVADATLERFFKPYIELVKGCLSEKGSRCVGICLGAQILAKALGGEVFPGDKGREVGFGKVKIRMPYHPLFSDLRDRESFTGFHLHGDTFTLPPDAVLLASSDRYENQIFTVEDRMYGFQVHLEPTWEMLQVWSKIHKTYMEEAGYKFMDSDRPKYEEMSRHAKAIFGKLLE